MRISILISTLLLATNLFGQTTIFSDSFTGSFPGGWTVGNDGGITGTTWGTNSGRSYNSDGWSAFCADNGNNTASTYPNNLRTYMERRNVSLAGYSSASLTFKYSGSCEANSDFFTVNVRNQNGSWSQVLKKSGTFATWATQTIDLTSFCGQSGLYVQFRFDSSRKNTGQGVWIDDVSLTGTSAPTNSQIQWSGYTWNVRSGIANPGPNNWSADVRNVWVDTYGDLHLKIRNYNNIWYCSEIVAQQSLGYGEYTFQVSTNVETLDKNVVLGLFTYETDTREIDVEFARWGVSTNPAAQFVVQPSSASTKVSFPLNLTDNFSTHKFNWDPTGIVFQSYYGLSTTSLIKQWIYQGSYNPPAGNERVHLNLWLYQGKAPSNLLDAEVVIKSFTYTNGVIPLAKCTPLTNLAAPKSLNTYYRITVPAGATNLNINTSGGTGDCNLYVKSGQKPTTAVWDYRSNATGNTGSVTLAAPAAGDYYILLNAYAAYTGVTLTACYTEMASNRSVVIDMAYDLNSGSGDAGKPRILSIYPNPSSERVTVLFNPGTAVRQSIEIVNSLGQAVYSTSIGDDQELTKTVDISHLAKGRYYVKLITSAGMAATQFIKE